MGVVAQRQISHYWIATVALLPRDDKKRITTTLSCHCERSEAIQSINLSQRDTYFLFNSVFAGANKFDYLDPGVKPQDDRECGDPAPRDDKGRSVKSQDDKRMVSAFARATCCVGGFLVLDK